MAGLSTATYARHAPRKGAGRSWLWITPKSGEFGTVKNNKTAPGCNLIFRKIVLTNGSTLDTES